MRVLESSLPNEVSKRQQEVVPPVDLSAILLITIHHTEKHNNSYVGEDRSRSFQRYRNVWLILKTAGYDEPLAN